jgi:hypothetical protein
MYLMVHTPYGLTTLDRHTVADTDATRVGEDADVAAGNHAHHVGLRRLRRLVGTALSYSLWRGVPQLVVVSFSPSIPWHADSDTTISLGGHYYANV